MEKITLFDLFNLGGVFMWPLLLFSVVTIALIAERMIFIFTHNLSVRDIKDNVLTKLLNRDLGGAVEYLKNFNKRKLGAQVLFTGLDMAKLGEHRMEKAMESDASSKINQLERGFNLLVALGSIAPITGFLGTVSGMISAFRSIANATDVNAQLVANGIFEALITTAYGLAIAIIAITGYNIFSHFVDKFTADIEEAGSDVVNTVLNVYGKNK